MPERVRPLIGWCCLLATIVLLAACGGPSDDRAEGGTTGTDSLAGAIETDPLVGPLETEPGELPIAPRLQLPTTLPAGTVAIVTRLPATLGADAEAIPDGVDYAVDATNARRMDYDTPADRALAARAQSWLSQRGDHLVPDDGSSGVQGLLRCTEFEGRDCAAVPEVDDATRFGFSPDGSKFVVLEQASGAMSMSFTVRIFDTDSLEQIVAARAAHQADPGPPVWRPDSGAIALIVPKDDPFGDEPATSPPADGLPVTSLATLDAVAGARPTVLAVGSVEESPVAAVGWSDLGDVVARWQERPSADPLQATHSFRSRAAVGGDADVALGTADGWSPAVVLSDGTLLNSPLLADERVVPHRFGPGADALAPLSRIGGPGGSGGSDDGRYRFMGLAVPVPDGAGSQNPV